MGKTILGILIFATSVFTSYGQTIKLQGKDFEISNVKTSVISLNGENVLKVERDLDKLPFDTAKLISSVDEPTFIKLKNLNLDSSIVEVKMLSRIQNPSPFQNAQGFIGLAFRINDDNSAFESIYLRPKAARADNQFARNHSIQYYAYPDFKFDKLRQPEFQGQFESYADVGLNEWITMRIEFAGKIARVFINNQKHPSFIVSEMKGKTSTGSIALWVDIGTTGYFKDLKIIKK